MVVLTIIFVLYFLALITFLSGWKRATQETQPPRSKGHADKEVLISVIIPVRNEALTITDLLEGLLQQTHKRFEIIVVNDGSEDETERVVNRFDAANLKVIQNKGNGKKAALTAGVQAARGSIIATTDADCRVPPSWLSLIQTSFKDPKVMMTFGGVRMEGQNTFFDSLQALEFASLIGAAGATAALGLPTLCNGANLAFRKKVFSQVRGYEGNLQTPSGDDEFLMRKIQHRYKGSIVFISSAEAVVTTRTQARTDEFFQQRIRWASKWRYNSSPVAKSLAVFVVLLQMAFVVNWCLLFSPLILQSLFLLAVKIILEAAFLLQVCRFLKTPWNWLAFFSLQIVYPPYVIGVALTSFFVPFRWKNRIFKPGWRFLQRRG